MNAEARQVLAELEFVSHGSVQAWNGTGGGSDRLLPPGESNPPHLYWAELFARCAPDKLPELVRQATAELNALRKRQKTVEASVSLDDLILEEGEGHDPESVARRFRVSTPFVCRLRMRHGLGVEDGRPAVASAKLVRAERRERAVELKAQGLTLRQIAALLQVDHKTVSADLKGAA